MPLPPEHTIVTHTDLLLELGVSVLPPYHTIFDPLPFHHTPIDPSRPLLPACPLPFLPPLRSHPLPPRLPLLRETVLRLRPRLLARFMLYQPEFSLNALWTVIFNPARPLSHFTVTSPLALESISLIRTISYIV